MSVFRNVVFVAALAGLVAGVVLAAIQSVATVPLILQAETYEAGGQDHSTTAGASHDHDDASATHQHDAQAWAPDEGFERVAYTALANVVSGIGFALVLVAISEMAGGIPNWRTGLLWGLAGFAVFTLAPGLGLPPELPAMPAADLMARQIWWGATALATGLALWLIVFGGGGWAFIGAGLALIVAPHLVGAPQPASHDSPIPADLHQRFVITAMTANLVFWLVLGATAGLLRQQLFREAEGLRNLA